VDFFHIGYLKIIDHNFTDEKDCLRFDN